MEEKTITVKDKNGVLEFPSHGIDMDGIVFRQNGVSFVSKLPDGEYSLKDVKIIVSDGSEEWDFSPAGAFELVYNKDVNGRLQLWENKK